MECGALRRFGFVAPCARAIQSGAKHRTPKWAGLLLFAYFAGLFSAVAEEPFFKKGDVIALAGGEDMVALSEYGYLELLLTRGCGI